MANWTRHVVCNDFPGKVKSNTTWDKNVVCDIFRVRYDIWFHDVMWDLVFSKTWCHVRRYVTCDMLSYVTWCRVWRDAVCDMLSYATRFQLWFYVACNLISSAIRCCLRFDVTCGHLKWILGLGHVLVFSEHETTCDLVWERGSCATLWRQGRVLP